MPEWAGWLLALAVIVAWITLMTYSHSLGAFALGVGVGVVVTAQHMDGRRAGRLE